MHTFAHYQIDGEIGRGGMGVVYRALDTRLGRPVAIKLLPNGAVGGMDDEAAARRRFVQEARAASALNHPHIVTIYEVGEHEGTAFIAMELVQGTPLDVLLARGPLPVTRALEYGAQVASALEAAHAAGIVHRDIKPANIMIAAGPPSSSGSGAPRSGDGRVKVLDFGLAKMVQRAAGDATISGVGTMAGTILGTAAYMSPEQAQGEPVDARTDVFSLGAVLYEMLAGRRPFAGHSDVALLTAILRDEPPALKTLRADVPADVEAVIMRCLAKRPEERYADGAAVRADLDACLERIARPVEQSWRRPAVLAPFALLLVAAAAAALWQSAQSRRAEWARGEAIPEIERLQVSDRSLDAVRLAEEAARYAPDDIQRVRQAWVTLELQTEPPGAEVSIRNYLDLDGPWYQVGTTPLETRVPLNYYRLQVSKPGYEPLEVGYTLGGRPLISLVPEAEARAGMVRVAGGPYTYSALPTATLPDFWIDRYEVTNREFQRFVDAGGYGRPEFWTVPFHDRGRELTFDEAMGRFRDATGQPGPAGWQFGRHPDAQEDMPVGGISWYEAAAFAAFAGKELPTVYHWFKAAGVGELFSDVLRLSNFNGPGPVRAGERQAVGPWGAHDMAGNVKEWCANATGDGALRYILGGAWHEAGYRFNESDAQSPWARDAMFGVRLVSNQGPVGGTAAAIESVRHDLMTLEPVPASELELLKRFYAHEPGPLDARVEAVDDRSEHWRMETVSFRAAYGDARVPAYLFLPKNATPPYQTVILFPSAYATHVRSSRHLDYAHFDFIIRSGRALLYPVYQGTYERYYDVPSGWNARRDLEVQRARDFFRAIDYLETREELALDTLAYYSVSMGAFFGPIVVSLEPRVRSAIFVAGGLRPADRPPEIQTLHFMPHVKVPVLLINGRDDFSAPLETQQRKLALLGTPPEHKRLVSLAGGHMPTDFLALVREVLDWLDTYQGRVRRVERVR